MADNILFKSGLASKLNDITKTAGQLLFAIDGTSGSIYLDKDSTTRIKMNLDATKLQNARAINGTPFDGTQNITTANWGTARTLTIGNKEQSVKGDTNVSWSLHDILYNTSQIGVATSWDITTPGVYCVGSSSSFTGTNNPESSNGGLTPYPYGQLIVSRANWGGLAQFYISHRDSDSTSYGIKFRTGWDSSYVSTWSSILDSTNYTNYTVTKTGGGASGTWGININGGATYLKPHNSAVGYASSTWGNMGTNVWGMAFSNTALGTDTGDIGLSLTKYSDSQVILNLKIDGQINAGSVRSDGIGFIGNLQGNASTATKLATARTISLTGSVTGSGSFDGSGNLNINTTTNHAHPYLPLSGGTLSGLLSAYGGISLNDSTPRETPQFILGIRAFADGGNIVWQMANQVSVGAASALTPITTTDKADSTNHWRRVWFSYIDNITGRPAYDDRFVFQTSTGTLKAPVFSGNKLYASSTDSDAIHTVGGILASYLKIDNANSGGWIELREDGEGGTITLGGPNGSKWWEIDCYNSSDLRIFSHDGSNYQFFVFGANGNLSAPSFSGNLNGNASTASALTPITDTDLASNADTWRRIWMGWADNTTGRPAYDDRFAIQTSTGTLKAPIFSGDLNGNASSASLLYPNSSFSYYRNSFQYFNFSAAAGAAVGVNDAPTTQWWHMLRCSHWNDLGFYTDVAIPFNNNHIYYKRVMAGSVQNGGWVMVYDTQNIVYSASAPSGPLVGTIWLQPI